jgi:hypothetical protein
VQRYTAKTEIAASAEAVFDYVADLQRHDEWSAHRLKIEPQSAGTDAAGARFTSSAHQLGLDVANSLTVVEVDRPRRFAFEAEGREGRFRHAFDLEPSGPACRLTKTFEVLQARFPFNLGLPFFGLIGPRRLAGDLRRIKARIEAAAGASPPRG